MFSFCTFSNYEILILDGERIRRESTSGINFDDMKGNKEEFCIKFCTRCYKRERKEIFLKFQWKQWKDSDFRQNFITRKKKIIYKKANRKKIKNSTIYYPIPMIDSNWKTNLTNLISFIPIKTKDEWCRIMASISSFVKDELLRGTGRSGFVEYIQLDTGRSRR